MNMQFLDKSQAVPFILKEIQQHHVFVFTSRSEESEALSDEVLDLVESSDDITSSLMIHVPVFDHIIDYLNHYSNEKFKSLILYNLEIDEEDIRFLTTSNLTSSMNIYILK